MILPDNELVCMGFYPKIDIGHYDLFSWFNDFVLYLQDNYIDEHTLMILSFQTDRSGQTVQTQIRLLLEEQSDQGLHCLNAIPFVPF